MKRGPWLSVCLLGSVACGDPEVLGATGCEGNDACTAPAFLEESALASSTSHEFEVVPREKRKATWTVPLYVPEAAHQGLAPRQVNIQPAPDGGVWVAQYLDPTRTLLRLDAAGAELSAAARPSLWPSGSVWADLTVSSTFEPLFEALAFGDPSKSRSMPSTGYVLRADGALAAYEPALAPQPARTFAGAGRSIRALTSRDDGHLSIHDLGRDGERHWAHDVPLPGAFEPAPPAQRSLPQVAVASDGSTLVSRAVVERETEAASQLLTLVDAEGVVKWQIRSTTWIRFAPIATGGFALAVPYLQGFRLYAVDSHALLLGSWVAQPASYHGGVPAGLASDAEGNLYFALVTGLRQTPEITVCKLSLEVAPAPPNCIGLDIERSGATRIDGIAVTGPNTVVVAYATSPTPANTGRFPFVSRVDF